MSVNEKEGRLSFKYRKSILFLIKTVYMGAMLAIFTYVWLTNYQEASFFRDGNFVVMAAYLLVQIVMTSVYGGFKVGVLRLPELTYSMVLATIITDIFMYIQFVLIARTILPIEPMGVMFFSQLIVIIIFSSLLNRSYFYLYPTREMLIVYKSSETLERFKQKISRVRERYKIVAQISEDTGISAVLDKVAKHNSIVILDLDANDRDTVLNFCYEQNKRAYIIPSVSDIFIRNSHDTQIFDTPVMLCKNRGPSNEQLIVKRIIDLVISSIALVVASPFFAIIALAIKICDKGPVFFKQERITKDERVFTLYKFRSMIEDADKDTDILMAKQDDPRITPVGKILRRFRLDEIPQLINILKGDMSLVGPRPERVELVAEYAAAIPQFNYRHKMRAGLTGLAQVNGLYNTSAYDKLLFDLMYMEQFSIFLDFKIIFMTFKVIFMSSKTEGNDDKTKNALG